MTQQELADELGRSEDWVSKVEHGVRMLNSIELIIYAHAIKSTAAEIHTEIERRVMLKRNPLTKGKSK
jgi:transcriptional regulator with XRE-family HTH domain